jgi:hypothetical protein
VVVHLVNTVEDRTTACGLRSPKRGPQTPYLLARFMERHEAGHARVGKPPPEWCPDCLAALPLK